WPARIRQPAIGVPIVPVPTKPICIAVLPPAGAPSSARRSGSTTGASATTPIGLFASVPGSLFVEYAVRNDRLNEIVMSARVSLWIAKRPTENNVTVLPVCAAETGAKVIGERVVQDGGMMLRFWGVRGSLPTPGAATVRYGGNTICVELRCGPHLLILDAGSG